MRCHAVLRALRHPDRRVKFPGYPHHPDVLQMQIHQFQAMGLEMIEMVRGAMQLMVGRQLQNPWRSGLGVCHLEVHPVGPVHQVL